MSLDTNRQSQRLASQAIGLAFAVPQVMFHRLSRMAAAGANPSPGDLREWQQMGAEKFMAAQEALFAMAAQAWVAQQQLATSFMRAGPAPWFSGGAALAPQWAQWQGAMLGILAHGVAPVHARAVANARRLGRRAGR